MKILLISQYSPVKSRVQLQLNGFEYDEFKFLHIPLFKHG